MYIGELMKLKKKGFKNNLILHPFITVTFVILLLFGFAFLLLMCLKGIDKFFYDRCENLFARLNGGVEVWFTFYGSYLGVIATVVLGLITLRLSVKIDRMNTADQINTLNVEEIYFYDFKRDYKPSVMMKNGFRSRYCFEIILKNYRANYHFESNGIKWGIIKEDNEPDLEQCRQLSNCKVYCEQNQQSVLYIYCDDITTDNDTARDDNVKSNRKIEDSLNFYYRLWAYEPITMQPYERKRILKIPMKIDRKMLEDVSSGENGTKDLMSAEMNIILENKEYKNGHILLSNLNCEVVF